MRIDRLALKGLLRFTDLVSLDFTTLPPGLIAVVGENGAGKTSLLEAMIAAFYRQLPSRGDVIDYATDRDSFIDVDAAFDGRGTYRARLNLDGPKRISDAVLERTAGGLRDTLNDGKVTTFDQVIAKELPPLAQLLASSFSAQNRRGSFSTLDRKGRRDLFASLLGLAQLEQHAATSRQASLAVDRRLGELRALVGRLGEETSAALLAALTTEAARLGGLAAKARVDGVSIEHEKAGLKTRRETAAADASRYQAAQLEQADLQRRLNELNEVLQQIRRDEDTLTWTYARDVRDLEDRVKAVEDVEALAGAALMSPAAIDELLRSARAGIDARLASDTADRQARIANNEALLGRADIREAHATVAQLRQHISAGDAAVRGHDGLRRAGEIALSDLRQEQTRLEATNRECEAAVTAAGLLVSVPCHGGGDYAGCELLKAAKAAEARIPRFRDELAGWSPLLKTITARVAENARLDETIAGLRAEIETARARADALQKTADLVPTLDAATTRVTELRAEIAALEQRAGEDRLTAEREADERREAWRSRTTLASSRVAVAKDTAASEREGLTVALEQARAGLQSRRSVGDADLTTNEAQRGAVVDLMATYAPAQSALETIDRELSAVLVRERDYAAATARLEAETDALARRRSEFDRRAHERDRLAGAVTALETELVEWQALARIFGAEGLPVLEIDAAGPGVSALANDLLQACFGGRFTVELVTQEPKADGKGFKEVFELKVFDGERGGEARDLTDLSGGEQVLVDEALKSAIALFVNQRNVLPIRTAWRDETTGALDPENALRYVAMLRRVHARAGLCHLFFVSHNPDAAALADAQIWVHDGTAEILLPPFGRREAA